MANFVRVASLKDLPPGEMTLVELDGEEVALANVDGRIYAFSNTCTHRGGPLYEGILEGQEVECPWHAGRFNIETGEATSPPPSEPIPTFRVQVEGDEIRIARA